MSESYLPDSIMTKARRTPRPRDELKRELVEQLQLLRQSCRSFDDGMEATGKHIALSLRLLLHSHGQSRGLLDQLGLRASARFLDSAGKLNPQNLLTECRLVAMHATPEAGRYVPLCAAGALPEPMRPVPFSDWWNEPVLKDNRSRKFCRRELILHVADTDGGAHVDPELDEAYMAISRQNSLGWEFQSGDIVSVLNGRPELACMRQIADEVLSTADRYFPEFMEGVRWETGRD